MNKILVLSLFMMLFAATSYAGFSTGNVNMLEVWKNGNVAFTLNPAPPQDSYYCNGQFIINSSAAGFKNQFATVLTAKNTGAKIAVAYGTCGPADNYGGNYIIPEYIYVVE